MGETAARLESLSGEARQVSLAGSYPGFRVPGQASVEGIPRWDGQREESETIRDFDPTREFTAMFGFGPGVSGMNISALSQRPLCSTVNKSRFLGRSRNQ